jgi:hypothetical protein
MKRHCFAALLAGGLGAALVVVACTGDDPTLTDVPGNQDAASSSGSSGASGSSGSTSGDSGLLDATLDAPIDALATFDAGAALVAFVHSGQFSADLGGLAGADDYCKQGAINGNLPNNGVDGAYLAWMADATQSPATRFKRSTTGYKRVDGVVLAVSWEDLTDGTIANALNIMDNGASAGNNALIWTNVAKDGTADSPVNNCLNWGTSTAGQLGNYGNAATTDATWTSSAALTPSAISCGNAYHLYCFQQNL